jgi:hypothetical protein
MEKDDSTETLPPLDYFKNVSCPSIPVRPSLYYYSAATTTTTAAAPVRREGSFLYFSLYCLLHRRWERERRIADTHTQKPRNVIYVQNRVETLKHGNSSNSVEKGVVQRREGGVVVWAKNLLPSQLLAPQQQPEGGSCCTQEEEDFGAPSGK